jgi:L,D-transpeptidase-like protein
MRLPAALVLSLSMATVVGVAAESSATASAAGASREATVRAFSSVPSLDTGVLRMALDAAACARDKGAITNDRLLTVIDYSKPSTEERLWVLDLQSERVLYQELVAHGQGSGENLATKFSNEDGSHQTSLGLFRTADTYVGSNGYSLRLDGLEPGVNDNARDRAIVMHGAPYVNEATSKVVGRLGRSWGCPALRPAVARSVIDTIKAGSLVFSYYPDKQWLKSSTFLNGCS